MSVEYVYRGRRINVKLVELQIPGRGIVEREVVEFRESVVILPLLSDGRVILIRQYRVPVGGWIYELPAGVIESGETPEECARRELIEETGYRAGKLVKLFEMYLAPGYSTEKMHAFLAEKLEYVGMKPESYEAIEVTPIEFSKVLDMVKRGSIPDAKTIATILYYKTFIAKN
ncbi:MAG TPA: NUDIX hydrolase [Desulfurococcales archaeon]|nr:NUDIX hydrolase [Desulfurococcales archaeon]